ncbi:MAG TPA: B12-binding domain-containing protein [Acidimicrobiales bacterium]|nr:B12-binding domain-containing protein [Acidimicrobiales bacterium]
MTLQEAADRLGVHYMTAYRYIRTGRLEAEKSGRTWLVDRKAVEQLAHGTPAPGSRDGAGSRAHRTSHADLLFRRLVADDEAGAWSVLQDALAWGRSPEEVIFEVIAPAMARIGDEWRDGVLDVADEHVASTIALRALARLGPQFNRRGPKRGAVVVGAPSGDLHGLPIALVADPLRGRGYHVVDLGPNTPAASFGHAAGHTARLVAVAIGATTRRNDDAIRSAIRAVRRAADVPVILGGAAVGSAAKARQLGADHHSPTGAAVLELVESLRAQV